MDSRATLKVDIGFYMGIILWALISPLHQIHVLVSSPKILTTAHMTTRPSTPSERSGSLQGAMMPRTDVWHSNPELQKVLN